MGVGMTELPIDLVELIVKKKTKQLNASRQTNGLISPSK